MEANPTVLAVEQISGILGMGEMGAQASEYVHKYKGKIVLEYRLVDNTSGEVVEAGRVEGKKSGSSEEEAMMNACKKAGREFLKQLEEQKAFRGRVAEESGEAIEVSG